MRHVFVKTGVISQASGSAYVEFDATKVMCGVYGPRQGGKTGTATNDRGRLDVDVKLATFATPGARGKVGQGDAELEFASLLHRALEGAVLLETFPKTSVDVYVTVLEAACAISCPRARWREGRGPRRTGRGAARFCSIPPPRRRGARTAP